MTVQNGQNGNPSLAIKGGYVTSVPAGIDCGEPEAAPGPAHNACQASFANTAAVVLTAHPQGSAMLLGWAGDCSGWDATCTLSGKADKYVLADFGTERTSHPNWSSPSEHGPAFLAQTLQCTACHGASLDGMGIAPSCNRCHAMSTVNGVLALQSDPACSDLDGATLCGAGHFDAAAAPWGDHGSGWSSSCTRCHTSQGFQDYVGADGTPNYLDGTFKSSNQLTSTTVACETAGTCDPAAYPYGPLECTTCHNRASDPNSAGLTQILFPKSLALVSVDRVTALCGQCHQGREASASVDAKAAATPDTVIPTSNSFVNPHYLGAAGTLFGGDAHMWGEYPGKVYTRKNKHAVNEGSCTSCHSPHTGDLPADADMATTCGRCHFDEATGLPVASFLQLEESRQFGFEGDIDGDGVQESLKAEIDGLAATVYAAMQVYATNVVGTSIVYDGASHPYYFIDANSNGVREATETASYNKFTPRLLRAAFNNKWAHAEPGAWAHNPRYAIEILFDAIEDLNAGIAADTAAPIGTPVAFAGNRTFRGHFGGAETLPSGGMPFADWDPGPVPANCSQCHAGETGFQNYLADQFTNTMSPSITGMQCTLCHAPAAGDANMKRIATVTTVNFPPRKTAAQGQVQKVAADFATAADMVCSTCHSGRENGASINIKIGTVTTWTLTFTNPHYLGAAGVMFGSEAGMLYQYAGKTYAGKAAAPLSPHDGSCVACHAPKASKHTFEPDLASCAPCHGTPAFNALSPNIATLAAELYARLQTYASAAGNPLCYNGGAYPYFFKDTNADGVCDAVESVSANGARFNPNALKAAFNYKWSQAEPGAWAHNYAYMNQALFDAIEDLGGTPTVARAP